MTTTHPPVDTPDHVTLAQLGAALRAIHPRRRNRHAYAEAAGLLTGALDAISRGAPITDPTVAELRATAWALIAASDEAHAILDATPQGFLHIEPTRNPVDGSTLWCWIAWDPDHAGETACGYLLANGEVDVYGTGNPLTATNTIDDILGELADNLDHLSPRERNRWLTLLGIEVAA